MIIEWAMLPIKTMSEQINIINVVGVPNDGADDDDDDDLWWTR